jgi:hypothetical protein
MPTRKTHSSVPRRQPISPILEPLKSAAWRSSRRCFLFFIISSTTACFYMETQSRISTLRAASSIPRHQACFNWGRYGFRCRIF